MEILPHTALHGGFVPAERSLFGRGSRTAPRGATISLFIQAGICLLAQHPDLTAHQVALIVVALGCGSVFLSHLNDGGFWIVKDCLGLTVGQTLQPEEITLVTVADVIAALGPRVPAYTNAQKTFRCATPVLSEQLLDS